MPWKETHVEEQRQRFIEAFLEREAGWQMSQLCDAFGISRKTGYKWVERFADGGKKALIDQSRARHTQDHATSAQIIRAVVQLRRLHPSWGARKLLEVLRTREADKSWPAASTIGDILKRHELIEPRRRRRRATPTAREDFRQAAVANDVWAADFKGWFRTRDGYRCDPLTISDLSSRYLLECRRVRKTNGAEVRKVFERVFREYGLPVAIRTDNGSPFASVGLGGLSALSVWWVKLGIALERIEPGRPDQNGRHERMHRTLKAETTRPAAANASAQQRAFNRFRQSFNWERPHEALGQACPAEHYMPSERSYPSREPQMEYAADVEVRRVRRSGDIKWRGGFVYLNEALIGEPVSLQEVSDRHWLIRFGPVKLALLDDASGTLLRIQPARTGAREARAAVENSGRPSGSLRSPQPQND